MNVMNISLNKCLHLYVSICIHLPWCVTMINDVSFLPSVWELRPCCQGDARRNKYMLDYALELKWYLLSFLQKLSELAECMLSSLFTNEENAILSYLRNCSKKWQNHVFLFCVLHWISSWYLISTKDFSCLLSNFTIKR